MPESIEAYSQPNGRQRLTALASRRSRTIRQFTEPAYAFLDLPKGRDGWLVARRVRAVRRGLAIFLWTAAALVIQAACLVLPGRPKVVFARIYWAVFHRLMGLKVRVIGKVATGNADRPIIFVSNHSSWVDVPVVGGMLDGRFVAKEDVARWPLISTIARLGRTVFVSRQRGSTGRERDAMRAVLDRGDNLILFPEGTSSDGSRVLPFRSSFFALAEPRPHDDPARMPLIQPISVVYDRLNGLPAGRASRPVFAWYGDMDIGTHFWQLAQHIDLRVTVLLHAPMDPARFGDRKALSHAVWRTVADGASTLRQNRPARPLAADGPRRGVDGSAIDGFPVDRPDVDRPGVDASKGGLPGETTVFA